MRWIKAVSEFDAKLGEATSLQWRHYGNPQPTVIVLARLDVVIALVMGFAD
jgi:hypothetical protein